MAEQGMDPALRAWLEAIAGRLARATADRRAAWRTPVVASLTGAGAPSARVMVLRGFASADWRLTLHTDARSSKVAGLTGDDRVELVFWDPKPGWQLRVAGRAAIETDPSAFDRLSAEARRAYAVDPPPGTPLDGPHGYAHAADDAPARFRAMRVTPETLDALSLDPDGHRRARAWRDAEGAPAGWAGTWTAP